MTPLESEGQDVAVFMAAARRGALGGGVDPHARLLLPVSSKNRLTTVMIMGAHLSARAQRLRDQPEEGHNVRIINPYLTVLFTRTKHDLGP
eukprot:3696779-Heterocapsa_arctica.AAC.1